MNDPYERSYYEIALTNSQVLSALAVLLLCLLGSFVAGMWVAREAEDAQPARVAGVESTSADTAESEQGEFQFFERRGAREGEQSTTRPDQSANAAEVSRTVSPVEIAPESRPQRSDPTRDATKRNEQLAQRQPAESTPALAPPTIRPKVEDSTPTKTSETERVAANPTPAPLTQMLVIQVLSSSDQEQAGKVAEQLKGSGYRAFLSSAEVEGRTMYRVRVGPYSDQAQAQDAAQKIKRQFRLNTWITAQS